MTEPTAPPRSRVARTLITIAVAGMVAMWGYVLYLAFGPGRADSPDKLADPAFAIAAQTRCDRALDHIATLPPAIDATDAVDRADTLAIANEDLTDMVADLRAIVPDGDDGVVVGRWLDDWDTYLGDRRAYAAALRTDPDARLLVSAKDRRQVTEFLDQFAKDNAMPACSTPTDAG